MLIPLKWLKIQHSNLTGMFPGRCVLFSINSNHSSMPHSVGPILELMDGRQDSPPAGALSPMCWAMALPEQARGTGQATLVGMAGPMVASSYLQSLQSMSTAIESIISGPVASPAAVLFRQPHQRLQTERRHTPCLKKNQAKLFLL